MRENLIESIMLQLKKQQEGSDLIKKISDASTTTFPDISATVESQVNNFESKTMIQTHIDELEHELNKLILSPNFNTYPLEIKKLIKKFNDHLVFLRTTIAYL